VTAILDPCEVEPTIAGELKRVGNEGWVLPALLMVNKKRQLFVHSQALLRPEGPALVKIECRESGLHADFGKVPILQVRRMRGGDRPIRIDSYEGLVCDG
jgi:hypothetical protein